MNAESEWVQQGTEWGNNNRKVRRGRKEKGIDMQHSRDPLQFFNHGCAMTKKYMSHKHTRKTIFQTDGSWTVKLQYKLTS